MAQWCRRQGVLHLALAHHAGDQAETVLMRLARGSGLVFRAGLQGSFGFANPFQPTLATLQVRRQFVAASIGSILGVLGRIRRCATHADIEQRGLLVMLSSDFRNHRVGKQLAAAAKQAGVQACVFDRAGYLYHGRVKALADGAREGGLQF